ncbi:MAG: Bug family tripartite tricarboxylate transporter substrate binding protein [Rhodospirillaceae bacterium]
MAFPFHFGHERASSFGGCFVALLLAALSVHAHAATAAKPLCAQKAVRLLVGFPPGGSTDILARLLAQGLSGYFNQGFLVDNRPGATGNIAAEAVARSRPDGCTYLVVSAAFASNVYLTLKPGYDPQHEFTPVTRIAAVHNVLVVHPSLPVNTVAGFVSFAKARPGETVMGTAGSGSTSHLAVELLKVRVGGLNLVQVPYKGLGPAVLDLVSGEIAGLFATTPPVAPHIRTGRLRALAVASLKRAAALPDVPTFQESGFPGFEAAAWNGIVAPAGTPYDTVTRLNVAIVELLKSPELRQRLATQGAEPIGDTPDEFRAYLRTEVEKWGRVVRRSGMRIE